MTDRKPINPSLFLRPEELRRAADLLFYAHRDFSRLGETALGDMGLGAADHRALHVIGRNPNITVSALMALLKVTKQSLHRTLKQLLAAGMITQSVGREDRRQKLMALTPQGQALVDKIEAEQHSRITQAYRHAGPRAIASFWEILLFLTDPKDREQIRKSLQLDDVVP
ncbi:MAG: MarR family transcriptional regulator [Pseudomonadota bacterium]